MCSSSVLVVVCAFPWLHDALVVAGGLVVILLAGLDAVPWGFQLAMVVGLVAFVVSALFAYAALSLIRSEARHGD